MRTMTQLSSGFVYLIQRGAGGAVKIGYSAHPMRRIAQLQTGTPEKLRVLATLPGDMDLERTLHKRFAAYVLEGEWYEPAQAIFDYAARAVAAQAMAREKPRREMPRTPVHAGPLATVADVAAARAKLAAIVAARGQR